MRPNLKFLQPESGPKLMEMEIIPELMVEEVDEWKKTELSSGPNSPICTSPKSPKTLVDLKDYSCANFILTESP